MNVVKSSEGYCVIQDKKKVFSGPRRDCIRYRGNEATPKAPKKKAPKKKAVKKEVSDAKSEVGPLPKG